MKTVNDALEQVADHLLRHGDKVTDLPREKVRLGRETVGKIKRAWSAAQKTDAA